MPFLFIWVRSSIECSNELTEDLETYWIVLSDEDAVEIIIVDVKGDWLVVCILNIFYKTLKNFV